MCFAALMFLSFPTVPETCSNPPREACLRELVVGHRQQLEASCAHCEEDDACLHAALKPTLALLGVHRPAQFVSAVATLNEFPRFHDTTGKPLNDAARRLVEGRLIEGQADANGLAVRATYPLGPRGGTGAAEQVPRVRISRGTWKYVLLQAEDWRGGVSLLVRNQEDRSYHAEMVDGARTELSALGLKELRVLGGGRIAHNAAAQTISVYGFSHTYGRCETCNRLAAELVRGVPLYRRFVVTWSNEGY